MTKILALNITLMFVAISATAQTYHENDKEGLRVFLRQPSAVESKINAEQLGLQISDTLNWQTDEEWINKVTDLIWNEDLPRRLIEIYNPPGTVVTGGWGGKNLSGILDASKWSKLKTLNCGDNQLTALDLSANTELKDLYCFNNQLMTLDLRANTKLQGLWCYNRGSI